MCVNHVAYVEVGEYVGVVSDKRFIAVEQLCRFRDASACVEEHVGLVAYCDVAAETGIFIDEIDNLLSEVVHVDNDFRYAGIA